MLRLVLSIFFLLYASGAKAVTLYGVGDGNRLFRIDTETGVCEQTFQKDLGDRVHQIVASPQHLFISYRSKELYAVNVLDKATGRFLKTIKLNYNLGCISWHEGSLLVAECGPLGNEVKFFDENFDWQKSIPLHAKRRLKEGVFTEGETRAFPFFMHIGKDENLRIIDHQNRFAVLGYDDVHFGGIVNPKNLIIKGQCSDTFVAYQMDSVRRPQYLSFKNALRSRGGRSYCNPSKMIVYSAGSQSKGRNYCAGKYISAFALKDRDLTVAYRNRGEIRIDHFDLMAQQRISSTLIGVDVLYALCFDEND